MRKRFLMVLAGLAALFGVGYLAMLFMFLYEPTPDKGDVEEMVRERDLGEFGEVEGGVSADSKKLWLLRQREYLCGGTVSG